MCNQLLLKYLQYLEQLLDWVEPKFFSLKFPNFGTSSAHLEHIGSSCLHDNLPHIFPFPEDMPSPCFPAHTWAWTDHCHLELWLALEWARSAGAASVCAILRLHPQPIPFLLDPADQGPMFLPTQVSWHTEQSRAENQGQKDCLAYTPQFASSQIN